MCEDKEQTSSVCGPDASELSSVRPFKVYISLVYQICVQEPTKLYGFAARCRYLQDHQVDDTGSELNYGAGKSKFYAASDHGSHANVSKLLPTNPNNKDQTLYLAKYVHVKCSIKEPLFSIR